MSPAETESLPFPLLNIRPLFPYMFPLRARLKK